MRNKNEENLMLINYNNSIANNKFKCIRKYNTTEYYGLALSYFSDGTVAPVFGSESIGWEIMEF